MRLTHLLSSSEGTSGVYNGHTPSTSSFDTSTPNSCPGLILHSKTQSWQDYRSQSSECPQAWTGQSPSVRSMSPRTWNSILHGPRKLGLPTLVVQVAKNQLPTQETQRCGFNPRVGQTPWHRKRQPTPVFLPGESMDRAWRATVHGVESVGHDCAHTVPIPVGPRGSEQVLPRDRLPRVT